MRKFPLLADFIHTRACKPICAKLLTLPPGYSVFCHYTTLGAKNKVIPVCGQSCGQSRFSVCFHSLPKSRKRRCFKDFRAFASHVMDGVHRTPKAGALPTALHPVIKLFYPAGRIHPNACLNLQPDLPSPLWRFPALLRFIFRTLLACLFQAPLSSFGICVGLNSVY